MKTSSNSTRPIERSSWRCVPSPQSKSRRSPPRRSSVAGSPRRAVGTEPAVPAKNSDRSIRSRAYRRAMLREFRAFVLRGNMVDLAVAVVIGTAFTAVVNALVKDIITPLIAAVGGEPNFGRLAFTINGSRFPYGDFLNALLTFLLVATVMFFVVVKPVNALLAALTPEEPEPEAP